MVTEEDQDMSSLHTKVVYHRFDRDLKDYIHDANDFWNLFIKNHDLNKLGIFPSLAKAFYYVSTMKEDDEIFYDTRWNYLYFWTGSKVLESSESSYFSDIMNLLKTVNSLNGKGKNLYTDDILKINKDKFKNLKDIYDYLENYKTINLKIGSSINPPCTAAYKNYVTTTHEFYKQEKSACQHTLKDNYCNVVNLFVKEYDKGNITKLSCDGMKDPKEKPEMKEAREDLDRLKFPPTQVERAQELAQLGSPPEEDTRDMAIGAGELPSPSGSTNALTTVFPLLGTASLAFFFLKFTPLGSSLYNSIFSKKIIRTNIEPQELLENSYEFPDTNIEENSHHIGYHNM
ncbi:PIR Superfamily Protein [Plasmodium ovale curtisi]|uniref:PIR Superfamily Protein n=1 Tax=Plasmodium ovale curtisi TaxID=864141 RepID=A0A1A8WD34_PLAOA|nr:PIR Superfamily Protein [Plasmodium ovale curtisi]